MKWFYLAGILLLGVLWCKANEEDLQDITKNADDDDEDFYAEVREVLEKKCKQQGGENAVKNLTRVLDGVKICLGDHLPKNTDELKGLKDSSEGSSGSSEEICTDRRAKIRECFNDFVHVWEDCSDPKEKYLPHFVFDAVEAVLDYICADDGAFILKIVNSLDCVFTLAEKENVTDVCNDKFKFLKSDTPEDIIITKEELCEDLGIAKTCYGEVIQQECPDSEFKDVVVGLYTAVHSACDKRHRRSLPLSFRLY